MGDTTSELPADPAGQEMPRGIMATPALNGGGMPPGQMRADDQPGFSPVSGEMPRGDMAAMGALSRMEPGRAATVLSEMPGGAMAAGTAGAAAAGLEMRGTFRLELSPGSFDAS